MNHPPDHVFVLPTLKIAGGNLEVVRLAEELRGRGENVAIIGMWGTQAPIRCDDIPASTLFDGPVKPSGALLSLPLIFLRFLKVQRFRSPRTKFIFTHYATYLLAPLVRRRRRWFFVQALEWYFVPPGPRRSALRSFIASAYRKGRLLAANPFLRRSLEQRGLRVEATADIWAAPFFDEEGGGGREYDVALMFRKGVPKRADWGTALLERLRASRPLLRAVIISPDDEFAGMAGPGDTFLLRPSREEIRDAYQRSRVFILFSDHEGFGLPPLEAMGCGCVPLCRDAGGVRAYMEPSLEANIIPLDASHEVMIGRLFEILDDRVEWSRLSALSRQVFRDGLRRAADRLAELERCGFVSGEGTSP